MVGGQATWPSPVHPGSCPHSPVLHDAAHVVDGTVAQVGAQEVPHQLRNTTCHRQSLADMSPGPRGPTSCGHCSEALHVWSAPHHRLPNRGSGFPNVSKPQASTQPPGNMLLDSPPQGIAGVLSLRRPFTEGEQAPVLSIQNCPEQPLRPPPSSRAHRAP